MDYNRNDQNGYYQANTQPAQGFAIASMILGILSLCSCCTGIFPVVFGSLSILFAVLASRRNAPRNPLCMVGVWLSVLGIVLGIYLLITSVRAVITDPIYREQFNQIFRQLYGMDLQEFIETYYNVKIQ